MQNYKFETLQARDLLKNLQHAFMTTPLVPRECVKSLNLLFYNFRKSEFSKEIYREITILILKGFSSKDHYLKGLIYIFLEELSKKSDDGILAVNSIVKDFSDKHTIGSLKGLALRALFSVLPATMRYDFQTYIKNAIIDDKVRDIAICIASKYFQDIKIPINVVGSISDYHCAFFNKMPINKYTSLIEFKKVSSGGKDLSRIAEFLNSNSDPMIFFEVAKTLLTFNPEVIASLVDKTVNVLRFYLQKGDVEEFASIKILGDLSVNFPTKVSKANREIENLVQSSSKTVSMLAIVTLLKTGTDETVKQLVVKIQPLLYTMSDSYKVMAIEAMEKLSKDSKKEFLEFLKTAFNAKAEIEFKRYLLKKIESLISIESLKKDILKFLCSYIEDPEYFQLTMDILGILGLNLENKKDLIHIYNRLILDNNHVRTSAFQSLFDLSDKFDTLQCFNEIFDVETQMIRSFLLSNSNIKKGVFDLSELGDLKEEVLKYAELEDLEKEEIVVENDFIKECRPIVLNAENTDFEIVLVKKIYTNRIILNLSIENKMEKVFIANSLINFITSDSSCSKFSLNFKLEDFSNSKKAVKEVEVELKCGTVLNGVFDYDLCFEEDFDEVENDSITLLPFDINIFDFIRPVSVSKLPEKSKEIELKFKLSITDAISKIASAANMFIIAEKDKFELMGIYNKCPVIIKGEAVFKKYTTVKMQIFCSDDDLIQQIASFFN